MRMIDRSARLTLGSWLVAAALLAGSDATPTATAQDSLAPKGAEPHWLPNEEWVNNLWLPYDEQRLYDAVGASRGQIFRWVRIDATHTLAQIARRHGRSVDAVAAQLVSNRAAVSAPQRRVLLRAARRTLTQGHLAQHLLFHALHQTAVAASAEQIFGVRSQEEFLDLRRAELSPLQIGDLHGRTRTQMRRGVAQALEAAAGRGVRRGFLTLSQKQLLLERQLRQVPRWLGQRRYNGPTGGRNRPRLPAGDGAKRPSISVDGSLVSWDAYRYDIPQAERLGEIHVEAARAGSAAVWSRSFAVSAPGDARSRQPVSSYNSVLSGDGSTVAFETAESTFPLAKRVGQMSVLVRALPSGRIEKVSHAALAPGAPTRTAFNPSLSGDGQLITYEATDSASATQPSRNGLFSYDRSARRELLLAEHGAEGAAFLPRISADGTSVVYTDANGTADGRTLVWLIPARGGERVLVSRAGGKGGEPADADAYEPAVSADGAVVAFTTRAANLGVVSRASKIVVRDLRAGTTDVIEPGADGDALEPALSADGRFVAYVLRARTRRPSPERLRSRVLLYDRVTGARVLISRRSGPLGAAADGYQSEPVVSADGDRVAFTSTASALSAAKPARLPGVFVRDVAAGTTTLLSHHAWVGTPRVSDGSSSATARAAAHVRAGLCVLGESPGAD